MCFAGEGCKVDCALAIISSSANVNIQTSDGLTALHFAAQSGMFVRRGASCDIPVRALTLAPAPAIIVCIIIISSSSSSILIITTTTITITSSNPGCTDIVRALVRAGADLNVTGGRYLRTPLHVASAAGHPYVCR
jgi:ankyrin repeat protein